MLYNLQLLRYAGENGVAAYGVMMYVSMIFSSVFFGYSIGIAPVVGFHFGAENSAELKNLLRKSCVIIGCFGVFMIFFSQIIALPLSKIFVGYDTELLKLTVSGFRIFATCFIFMGYAIFISAFFTALSDGVTSATISFLRTLVFEIAAILILPLVFDINGIWLSVVFAEFTAVTFSLIFLFAKREKYKY
jgi:Na+-driven multidrug efflux pump